MKRGVKEEGGVSLCRNDGRGGGGMVVKEGKRR